MKNKRLIILIPCILIVLLSVSALVILSFNTLAEAATSVFIDCSVSVELTVSESLKVTDITGIDNYAKKMLEGIDIINLDIKDAANVVFSALADENYISKSKNTILLSAQQSNFSAKILDSLSFAAQNIFPKKDIQPCILIQEVAVNDTVSNIASNYEISYGKARYIYQIIKQDIRYTIDDLANLSANELNIITLSGNLMLENVSMLGLCSSSGYITSEDAIQESLSNAKLWKSDVNDIVCTLDVINGRPVYRVLFSYDGLLYEYEIDSKSGTLLFHEKSNDVNLLNEINTLQYYNFTYDQSVIKYNPLLVAANHAGVEVAHITNYYEFNDGSSDVHELNFTCDGYSYKYYVNITTNDITDYSKKKLYLNNGNEIYTFEKNSNGFIGADNASIIAFNHAGISTDDVINFVPQIIKSRDDVYYEISFTANGYNFSYTINARNNEIVKYEKYKFN